VGKLSGTRLRSSVLGISRIGGGAISGLMGWSSGLAAGGLRPSTAVARVLWREEVDAWHVMRDPRQRTTGRPSMCSDQGSHRAANGGRLYGRSARWSKRMFLTYRRKLESSSLWVQGLFKGNAMRLNTRAQLWAGDLGPAKPSKPAVAMIEVLRVLRVRVT
jgi:hypothetical protein